MNAFLAMGVPTANPNDPIFFLRLPHLWAVFLIPIVSFYGFLAVWVVRKVREAMAAENHVTGTGPSSGSTNRADRSGAVVADGKVLIRTGDLRRSICVSIGVLT